MLLYRYTPTLRQGDAYDPIFSMIKTSMASKKAHDGSARDPRAICPLKKYIKY